MIERTNDLDQNLLRSIIGIARRSSDATADGMDPVVMSPEQGIHGNAITASCGIDQPVVVSIIDRDTSISSPFDGADGSASI
ncbi:hypothetical protein V6O07_06800, partial [Arthrospira platensis SPKY2]